MTKPAARWEQPGYGDIAAARVVGSELETTFVNGDVERVPLSLLGLDLMAGSHLNIEDGLSIRFGDGDDAPVVSWVAIRSAVDPPYKRHLLEIHQAEAQRIGQRLKALREDRQVTLAQLAEKTGFRVAQLSAIERGDLEIHTKTVEALLRELGAGFADIAGPDAPEVSVRSIVARAAEAGVPRELGRKLAASVPRRAVPRFLARAFGWPEDTLLTEAPAPPPLRVAVQFKAASGKQPNLSPLVQLALAAARLARTAFTLEPYASIPSTPEAIRQQAQDSVGRVTLQSLLSWTWTRGVPVLPLIGNGGFSAAVFELDESPIVIIKEPRDLAVFWLFDLAHELGHIAGGHVRNALIDVGSPTQPAMSDQDEASATHFALELLLPNHPVLLDEIRADARGSGVRFKFAVERVAASAHVSPGVLGIVAAFALTEVGRPQDRWGSATNLARPEGSGRETVRAEAQLHASLESLQELDAVLMQAAVLEDPA